jgi:hypothetical protein
MSRAGTTGTGSINRKPRETRNPHPHRLIAQIAWDRSSADRGRCPLEGADEAGGKSAASDGLVDLPQVFWFERVACPPAPLASRTSAVWGSQRTTRIVRRQTTYSGC